MAVFFARRLNTCWARSMNCASSTALAVAFTKKEYIAPHQRLTSGDPQLGDAHADSDARQARSFFFVLAVPAAFSPNLYQHF
jgi:hypothetical protein